MQWELQILQVCVPENKLFKDYVQRYCSEWTAACLDDLTPKRNIKKSLLKIIWERIIQTWGLISEEITVNNFKKARISNALEGTEDDYIWEERNK
jgi:hypothetical protein